MPPDVGRLLAQEGEYQAMLFQTNSHPDEVRGWFRLMRMHRMSEEQVAAFAAKFRHRCCHRSADAFVAMIRIDDWYWEDHSENPIETP